MDKEAVAAFKKHKVVPDIVKKAPPALLKVTYKGGFIVFHGNPLKPVQVQAQPTVKWDANDEKFYTIVMSDLDAPCRQKPKYRAFLHWIVINIPGLALNDGDVLCEYVGAAPAKGTGLHRYVILLYEQSSKIENRPVAIPKNSDENRPNFPVESFAKQYGLGAPIAGNFFQAEWDEYVPIVQKQLLGGRQASFC